MPMVVVVVIMVVVMMMLKLLLLLLLMMMMKMLLLNTFALVILSVKPVIHITLPPPSPLCSRNAPPPLHNEPPVFIALQRPLLRARSTATTKKARENA